MNAAGTYPSGYKREDGIFFPVKTDQGIFRYSDGSDFEQALHTTVAGAEDKSLLSRELAAAITNWPLRCHLSPARANILRPLEATIAQRTVLELGAGCGAVTRYLGEIGARVLALEASPIRARILRQRTIDQPNVNVVCERIETFEPEQPFDLVTLIGVLQYARLFSDLGRGAEDTLLACSARMVAPDGALLIAIQNPLGLRYWGGWPEPNADIPFFGIEKRYSDRTAIRFGLQQLRQRLKAAGLEHTAFLFPFPDYHIASTILTEAGMDGLHGFNPADIAAMSESQSRRHPDFSRPLFSMEQAWQQVFDEGLGQRLANAFVVLAAKSAVGLSSIMPSGENLGWHYSLERPSYFATSTRFHVEHGRTRAEKKSAFGTSPPADLPLDHVPQDEPYHAGVLWWTELVRIVNTPDWSVEQVGSWARTWLETLIAAGARSDHRPLDLAEVHGRWFDANPLNLIRTSSGDFQFFDLEWRSRHPIPLRFLAIKLLFGGLSMITSCARPAASVPGKLFDLTTDVVRQLGFTVDEGVLDAYFTWHHQVQMAVAGGETQSDFPAWREDLLKWDVPTRDGIRDLRALDGQLDDVRKELADTRNQLADARNQLADAGHQVARLEAAAEALRHQVLQGQTVKGSTRNLFRSLRRRLWE